MMKEEIYNFGHMTKPKVEKLFSWFENELDFNEGKIVIVADKLGYKSIQSYIKQGIFVTIDEGFNFPREFGGVMRLYSEYGRCIYIVMDMGLERGSLDTFFLDKRLEPINLKEGLTSNLQLISRIRGISI